MDSDRMQNSVSEMAKTFDGWHPNVIEALTVAQRENVHSAMLGFLLSDERLNVGSRLDLLRSLHDELMFEGELLAIDAETEWNHIDILVRLTFAGGESGWVAIENKLKSSEHGDQLDRYDVSLQSVKGTVLGKVMLSLTGETPRRGSHWRAASYDDLLRGLTHVARSAPDHESLRAYVDAVRRLVDARTLVQRSPHHATQAFSPTASVLDAGDGFGRFLHRGRMKMMLQRAWMCSVRDLIMAKLVASDWRASVGETHGAALLDIARVVTRDGGKVRIGVQIQYRTVKVFAHPDKYNADMAGAAGATDRVLAEVKDALGLPGKATNGKFRSFTQTGEVPAGRDPQEWADAVLERISVLESVPAAGL